MKSKHKGCLLPVLLLVLVLLAGMLWLNSRGFGPLVSAWQSFSRWAGADAADYRVSIQSGDLTISADGWWTDDPDGRIYALTAEQLPLFIQGQTLALDNGRCYALPALPDWEAAAPELLLALLTSGQITTQNETTRLHLPEQNLAVTVTADQGQMSSLELEAAVTRDGTSVPLALRIQTLPTQSHSLSAQIRQALAAEDPTPLLEPLEPLLPAIQALSERETVSGDLNVTVDCGVLTIDETLEMEFASANGTVHLRRGGLHVPLELPELEMLLSPAALPLVLLRNGTFTRTGDVCQWRIDVEPALTESLFTALIPELAQWDLDFARMEAQLLVADGSFQTVTISGSGEIPFLVTTIPITVTMALTLE